MIFQISDASKCLWAGHYKTSISSEWFVYFHKNKLNMSVSKGKWRNPSRRHTDVNKRQCKMLLILTNRWSHLFCFTCDVRNTLLLFSVIIHPDKRAQQTRKHKLKTME